MSSFKKSISHYPFVETIRIQDGQPQNLQYHQRRINRTFKHFYPHTPPHNIASLITVPQDFTSGVVKARFLYNQTDFALEFHKYQPKQINCLRLVTADWINYDFKFTDRQAFQKLLSVVKDCNEIIIVKNGYITDTSFSNLVFFDGYSWVTPETCLLPGTYREYLLDQGLITAQEIKPADLKSFTHFKLINALLAWDMEPMPITKIHGLPSGV